jgi:gas vesicle protein
METFSLSACLPATIQRIRRREDMGENSGGGDKVLFFIAGAGIGAVLALLFAPKSGRETRELLARSATDSRDFIANKYSEGRQMVDDKRRKITDDFSSFLDKSKEAVQRQKEQLSAAFEAGKAAYREEKGIPNE